MGRHAYLIIANRNPKQLTKLLKALDDCRNDIFVMIDKKSKDIFEKVKLNFSSLTYLKPINIFWGDVSQIQAELNLFEESLNAKRGYEYYHLLSGLDLPLASQNEIHNFFQKHSGKEFIAYSSMVSTEDLANRLKKHHFTKTFRTKSRLVRLYHKIDNKFLSFLPSHNVPHLVFASNWVSLEGELVSELIKNKEEILKRYKNSLCADELFIPIFIEEHPKFKEKVFYKKTLHDSPYEFQGNLRYINWWDGTPYTWHLRDYHKLIEAKKRGHLFARKFDETVDSEIIDKIIEYIE